MSKAKELLDLVESSDVEVLYTGGKSAGKKRGLVQYTDGGGNTNAPVIPTRAALEAGVFKFVSTMSGIIFEKHEFATDELLRFKDAQYEEVVKEVEEFWKLAPAFKQFGFTHTRGFILEGYPGTGKSCLIKIIMESIIRNGDVVFSVKDCYSLVEGLKTFREIEPDRKAFVVMEDLDGIIDYGSAEHALLELLDGDSQVDGVLYIATTNFLHRIPERLRRAGRFDKIKNIGFPVPEGRKAYLSHKLSKYETKENIDSLVNLTSGLGFNHLKEMILRVYVFKEELMSTIRSLRSSLPAELQNRNDRYIESMLAEAMTNPLFEARMAEESQDAEVVKSAFATRLDKLGFEGISVENVEISPDGDVIVAFKDEDGNEMEVLFGVDYSGSVYAMVLDAYGDDEDVIVVDLDPVSPTTFENEFGTNSVDLANLGWLNTSTIDTILRAGDIVTNVAGKPAAPESDEAPVDGSDIDAFGNKIVKYTGESYAVAVHSIGDWVCEKVMQVVRAGKKLKLPILRSESRMNLSFKQKESLAKAKKVPKGRRVVFRRKSKVQL